MKAHTTAVVLFYLIAVSQFSYAQQEVKQDKVKELEDQMEEFQNELKILKDEYQNLKPGKTKFILTGYGFLGFTDEENQNSSFNTGFNPIFLWELNDNILFEGELEVALEDTETSVSLEYSHLTFILNDYMTLGAGKFLNPANYFVERLHPAWINRLPDKPLPFGETGVIPDAQLGFQLRGRIPIGEGTSVEYALFVSNGPALLSTPGDQAGVLTSDNWTDNNNGKSIGGRLGLHLMNGLELGGSLEGARVGESGTSGLRDVDALMYASDFHFWQNSELLQGRVELLGQWAWLNVDNTTYDPTGADGFGPLTYENKTNGGYVQFGYRPSQVDNDILKNIETAIRYDALNYPSANPNVFDENRWTLGLDYWFGPSTVLKTAYRFDDKKNPGVDANAFLVQFALGF